MVKFWTSRRLGRGDFFFSVLGLEIAELVLLFWLSSRGDFFLRFGFRTEIASFWTLPPALMWVGLAFDAALLWCTVRRLRDIGLPGWVGLAAFAGLMLLGPVGLIVALAGLIALALWPGTVGPNKLGPDPRGWKSREHFEDQERRLRSGEV